MSWLLFLFLGTATGALTVWTVWGAKRRRLESELAAERAQRSATEQRLTDLREHYEARLRDAAANDERLRTQLEALLPRVADQVLASKSEQLQQVAKSDFQLIEQQTAARVAESNLKLQTLVEEMKQRIERYQSRFNEVERERAEVAARMEQQVAAVLTAGQSVAAEARTLKEALKTSHGVRGRWGEAVLKNILDSCGLNEGTDYELQTSLNTGESQLRPDAVVHLPSGRDLIIDSKANLMGFLEAIEESDEERRRDQLREFAVVLRRRADELGGKDYSRNLSNSVPCVVMFVPSEAAFRAALDADPELFRYGQDKRPAVLLASPTTLFPLISIVAHGWQQHVVEKKAQQLAAEVARFGESLRTFFGHVQRIGKSIDAAGKAYGDMLGSFNHRIRPKIERLSEMSPEFARVEELSPIENQLALPVVVDRKDEEEETERSQGAAAGA